MSFSRCLGLKYTASLTFAFAILLHSTPLYIVFVCLNINCQKSTSLQLHFSSLDKWLIVWKVFIATLSCLRLLCIWSSTERQCPREHLIFVCFSLPTAQVTLPVGPVLLVGTSCPIRGQYMSHPWEMVYFNACMTNTVQIEHSKVWKPLLRLFYCWWLLCKEVPAHQREDFFLLI